MKRRRLDLRVVEEHAKSSDKGQNHMKRCNQFMDGSLAIWWIIMRTPGNLLENIGSVTYCKVNSISDTKINFTESGNEKMQEYNRIKITCTCNIYIHIIRNLLIAFISCSMFMSATSRAYQAFSNTIQKYSQAYAFQQVTNHATKGAGRRTTVQYPPFVGGI